MDIYADTALFSYDLIFDVPNHLFGVFLMFANIFSS